MDKIEDILQGDVHTDDVDHLPLLVEDGIGGGDDQLVAPQRGIGVGEDTAFFLDHPVVVGAVAAVLSGSFAGELGIGTDGIGHLAPQRIEDIDAIDPPDFVADLFHPGDEVVEGDSRQAVGEVALHNVAEIGARLGPDLRKFLNLFDLHLIGPPLSVVRRSGRSGLFLRYEAATAGFRLR